MTDLSEVLPDFDTRPYRHLTHSLEKNDVSVAELISLDPIEIAKRCPLPLADLRNMIQHIIRALQDDLGLVRLQNEDADRNPTAVGRDILETAAAVGEVAGEDELVVKTLDGKFDECLGGGFRPGYITEIVGESAVGKTQFVLGLLLNVQLKRPHGLGKSAIYLSTEAPLNTLRLQQMLSSHPVFDALALEDRPSLDRIHTISTNDLETQEHIIRYQLPLAVQRFDAGLVVMDSVAANFRAEHETRNAQGLAERALDLTRLGTMLRNLARDCGVVVVVTNQVSDRFDDPRTIQDRIRSSSPLVGSSPMPPPPLPSSFSATRPTGPDEVMSLDHQQRFFTGWGDQPTAWHEQLKTPALGLSWANQLSARVVLKMESERVGGGGGGNIWKDKKKRRYMGVVFAPWAPPTLKLVEYEITSRGAVSVSETRKDENDDSVDDHGQETIVDPSLWLDGTGEYEDEDEEFP